MRWIALLVSIGSIAALGACGKDESPDNFTEGGQDISAVQGQAHHWKFDDLAAGSAPVPFFNVLGDWRVAADAAAYSASNTMKQQGDFKKDDYPRLVVLDLKFTNPSIKVRCKPVSGSTDQACGILFRMKDSNNYYVTRANTLEGNVRLYRVVDRDRQELASYDTGVAAGSWGLLEIRANGTTIKVLWNGSEVISATDSTFSRGNIGLWTKADSRTDFDDLESTEQ
jgi:hypothetical protein